jgi:glutaryl-CoA dehydrogenase (non-decarboxylating)
MQPDCYREFAASRIAPYADQIDRQQLTPGHVISSVAEEGYLGALIPEAFGGRPLSMVNFGLLNQEIGRCCSSVRSLLTVHSMVSFAVNRWGGQVLKQVWLPRLATGEAIGAFALSEPDAGSAAGDMETTATRTESGYVLRGTKKWTTYGQIAHVYLTFAKCDEKPLAVLLPRETPGLTVQPIRDVLGTAGSMIAELRIDGCQVPLENIVGSLGFGLAAVALSALDIGRYSVAWGCVGVAQACLDASLDYTRKRKQFGQFLKDHQLIQHMITDMVTNVKAARLLCMHAGSLRDQGASAAMGETLVAKYFSSRIAFQAASDAVQIHGANGCSSDYPVQRYLRDAKIMEIIEGSHQMQQILIAQEAYRQDERKR